MRSTERNGSTRRTPVPGERAEALLRERRVRPGTVFVEGRAWSGFGPMERVEFSADGGRTWEDAELGAATGASAAVAGWPVSTACCNRSICSDALAFVSSSDSTVSRFRIKLAAFYMLRAREARKSWPLRQCDLRALL